MKNFIISALLFMSVWLLLNASLSQTVIISGLIATIVITLVFSVRFSVFSEMKLNPKAIGAFIIFFFVFTGELIKANVDVALRVLSPVIPINPGIVEIKTNLKTDIGRLFLANSITLTPGTLTVDIKGDRLFIHWIDVTSKDIEATTKEIAGSFEKYLEVIYG